MISKGFLALYYFSFVKDISNYSVKKAKVVKKDLTGFFSESPKVQLC